MNHKESLTQAPHPYHPNFFEDHLPLDQNREPLTESYENLQSHFFDIPSLNNPLVAACAPLLTIAHHLKDAEERTNDADLLRLLIYEIKVFENKSLRWGYRSTVVLAARYFLCCFLDEQIQKSNKHSNKLWQRSCLLEHFQHESFGGEQFFLILERSCEDSQLYIDLIELGYLCLNLGYEGKFLNRHNAHYQLLQYIQRLYRIIKNVRGEYSKELFIGSIPKMRHEKKMTSPMTIAFCLTVLGILMIYLPYRQSLDKSIRPLISSIHPNLLINK